MKNPFLIAGIALLIFSQSGCERTMGFPNLDDSYSSQFRDADWPEFLPLDTFETVDLAEIERSLAKARAIEAKVRRLHEKARKLKEIQFES